MINNRNIISILILIILLTGCSDQRILEKVGFTHSVAYDLGSEGQLKSAISVPVSNPDIKTNRIFLKTESKSSKGGRINLNKQTSLTLVSGQLRLALFGQSIASKEGLRNNLDTLMRDPSIGDRINIIIVNGDAGNLLEKNFKQFPPTGKYIDRLIHKESAGQSIPNTTLYTFTRDYYDDGIDPIAPMIKDAGESIRVDGVALFKDDKVVGKIKPQDLMIFAFLRGNLQQGELDFDLSNDTQESQSLTLTAISSKKKVHVTYDDNQMKVMIHVNVLASATEYIGELKLSDNADRRKLEQEISEITTQRAQQVIKYLQEKKADSLGIGTYVRNSMPYSNWSKLNWHDQYPLVNIECHMHIKITDYGFLR
ncbi:Ger(x)C family spore germination protein [Paenibacillus crassostreae]|uniref:Uncharacterized protein n=1 Tax=Paenibacillus crassostreae TaxID=1763538 RepID=A0A167B5G2_9BACL|nr:Ger(x)C family spore germination protein [Paenibacillus crassostreae]AOZ93152.1 hypothetical protein LPB68_13645 [Paenibacillus crassostreae]OAB71758.1 hypothetical protein PNBC_17245 [Paenibacillus crassostreae]